MRITTAQHYQKRFQCLIEYIFQNLENALDLNKLAEVACISPYHLHRLYRCQFGETLADTVKRIRLYYAAQSLLESDASMQSIAEQAGYGSVQAFSRAFRFAYSIPPAQFRLQGEPTNFEFNPLVETAINYPLRIEQKETSLIAGFPHQGDFMDIGRRFEELYIYLMGKEIETEALQMCGLFLDDPGSIEESNLRSLAGITINDEALKSLIKRDSGCLTCWTQPAGAYAVLRFKGPYNHLHKAYQWLFGHWLPQSEYLPGNTPVMEVYLNNPRQFAPSELLTDIYLSLESAN